MYSHRILSESKQKGEKRAVELVTAVNIADQNNIEEERHQKNTDTELNSILFISFPVGLSRFSVKTSSKVV